MLVSEATVAAGAGGRSASDKLGTSTNRDWWLETEA